MGFGLGAAAAPQQTDTLEATVSAPIRPVINAPGAVQRAPALARVKHAKKRANTRATGTTTAAAAQQSAGVSGRSSTQPQTQNSGGSATSVAMTKPQQQQSTQPQTDSGTTPLEPPPFDEHTTSTP